MLDDRSVLAYRIHAQELDVEGAREAASAAVLDAGVQDTGRDGASWALANRGVAVAGPEDLGSRRDLALAWTLRASPHYHRRSELAEVAVATSPLSDRDAAKRVVGADKPWREAGIGPREGLAEVAARLREVVGRPMSKGEASAAVSARLAPPYLRWCGSCGATHCWEVPFRLGALYGGLELEPETSPPVLRRITGWPRRRPGPAADPLAAPAHLQPIRNYLRFLGPATPQDVAAFLDSATAEVKAHWPEDAEPVELADGTRGWLLPGAETQLEPPPGLVRLLGPYDLLLQGRDRTRLVPDRGRHRALWPVLGRPGAVLVGAGLVGTWRPKATGDRLRVRLSWWSPVPAATRAAVAVQAERLAAHRGLRLAGIDED